MRLGLIDLYGSNYDSMYFNDYDSHRLTEIGAGGCAPERWLREVLLANPGSGEATPTATPTGEWSNKVYSYGDDDHQHAVTEVDANSRFLRPSS